MMFECSFVWALLACKLLNFVVNGFHVRFEVMFLSCLVATLLTGKISYFVVSNFDMTFQGEHLE